MPYGDVQVSLVFQIFINRIIDSPVCVDAMLIRKNKRCKPASLGLHDCLSYRARQSRASNMLLPKVFNARKTFGRRSWRETERVALE